ncbi:MULTISPECIES: hypothetical protein [unclassified Kitasatospora]|uniref:hypothetical protein n=1 Tax=unclassified Kitasatospora TaxID=2633591 RepID=UPI00070B98ED|nr:MULTISPECIES: hypothetical protein [unclassified Kitasatospora]
MTPETQPVNSPQDLLERWIGDLPHQLLLLEQVLLPGAITFDYSPGSLDALERQLLERHDAEQHRELTEAATAYLGEVLLGVAGGAWGWHTRPVGERPGQPVVRPDQELELSPVAPMLLISYALRVRTGTAFAEEVERLRQAVAERRHEVPGWEPVKEHTPGVDPGVPLPEHPALTAWLAERREALSAWAGDAFGGAWRWNLHPETLDWLETVLRQRFATAQEFDAAREEPFVQGAGWYLGEVIRRNRGAVWQYVPAPGSSLESGWTGVPFVDQPAKRGGGAAVPSVCLRELFDGERKDSLRDLLSWFRPTSYAHVGALLQRLDMVSREKVDSVLTDYADFAHNDLPPNEVADALQAFGVAISAHADDVDDLEESYAGILAAAAELTDGAVSITDVRLRADEEYDEVLEFARNGVLVTQPTEHQSDEYLDHLAIVEFIGHVDPDPGTDPRRFHMVDFVRQPNGVYETYFVFATPEQAAGLARELGVELH